MKLKKLKKLKFELLDPKKKLTFLKKKQKYLKKVETILTKFYWNKYETLNTQNKV
jgi:hypothetical protein